MSSTAVSSSHKDYREAMEAHDTATMAFWAKEISERMSGTRRQIYRVCPALREPPPPCEK